MLLVVYVKRMFNSLNLTYDINILCITNVLFDMKTMIYFVDRTDLLRKLNGQQNILQIYIIIVDMIF